MASKKRNPISEQFVAHRVTMLESPAWGALSFAARCVLDRLEIEHAHHGGKDNGRLPCTYDDFKRYGVRRASVANAIRELVAFGFVEVTRQGHRTMADNKFPSLYRITYLYTKSANPTDEWKKITEENAPEIKAALRCRPKKTKIPDANSLPAPDAQTSLGKPITGRANEPTTLGPNKSLLSISREVAA